MKQFKDGDRFYVKENGIKGQIITTEFLDGDLYYVVLWDSLASPQHYKVEECDPIWEPDPSCPVVQTQWKRVGSEIHITVKSPAPIQFLPVEIDMSKLKVECNGHHSWVNVGFHFTKEVCRYCDVEKKA